MMTESGAGFVRVLVSRDPDRTALAFGSQRQLEESS